MTNRSGIQWKNTAWDFYGNVLQWFAGELSELNVYTGPTTPPAATLGRPNDLYFADDGSVYKKYPDPTGWVFIGDLSGAAIDPAQLAAIGGMRYRYDLPLDASSGLYPVSAVKGELYPVSVKGVIVGTEYAVGDFALFDGTSWKRIVGNAFGYERQYDFPDNSFIDIVVGNASTHRSVLLEYIVDATTYHQYGNVRIIHDDSVCEVDHQKTGAPANIKGLVLTSLISGSDIILRLTATAVGSNLKFMIKNRNVISKAL